MFGFGSDYMPFFGDLGVPSLDFRYSFSAVRFTIYKFYISCNGNE